MTAPTLHLVARIVAKPEKAEEVRELLLGLVEPTRKEAGCIRYDLHQDRQRPTEFVFLEEWTDEAALDEHLQMPYIQAAFARTEEFFAGAPELMHRMNRIG